jgi:hypothetical protein
MFSFSASLRTGLNESLSAIPPFYGLCALCFSLILNSTPANVIPSNHLLVKGRFFAGVAFQYSQAKVHFILVSLQIYLD